MLIYGFSTLDNVIFITIMYGLENNTDFIYNGSANIPIEITWLNQNKQCYVQLCDHILHLQQNMMQLYGPSLKLQTDTHLSGSKSCSTQGSLLLNVYRIVLLNWYN